MVRLESPALPCAPVLAAVAVLRHSQQPVMVARAELLVLAVVVVVQDVIIILLATAEIALAVKSG